VTRPITFWTVAAGNGGLPGLRVLSRNKPSTPSFMNRSCQRHTTGLALPDRRMISPVAAARRRGEDDLGTPHVFLRRAAVSHDRLKSMAVGSRDVDDNSCSHAESLNCFGQFGNRLARVFERRLVLSRRLC
jgi:hypothetical protein